MSYLSFEYLRENWSTIETIDISHNPWDCGCENRWLIESLVTQISHSKHKDLLENAHCFGPKKWKNQTLLQVQTDYFTVQCENNQHLNNYNNVVRGLFIALLTILPVIAIGIFLYRRNYFRHWPVYYYTIPCCRTKRRTNGFYNRADFGEELS